MKDLLNKIALIESKTPKKPVSESWTDFEDAKKAHEKSGGSVTGRPDDYTVTLADGTRRRYITKDGKRKVESLPPVKARDDDEEGTTTKPAKKKAEKKSEEPAAGAKRRGRPPGSKNKKKVSEMTDAEWHLFMNRVALVERQLSEPEKKKKEEIAKSMKDSPEKVGDLKKRYGKRWKDVVYATATKKAKQVSESIEEGKKPDFLDVDKDGDKQEPMTKALKDKKELKEGGMAFQEGDYVYFGSNEGTIQRFDGNKAIIEKPNGDLTVALVNELSSEKPGMLKKAASWMIGDSLQEDAVEEDDVEEGNLFTGNLAKARAAGKKEADLDGDGDMEKVSESEQIDECGDMGPGSMMPDQQDKVNVNANMDSDGRKTINVSAEGDAAEQLAQLLKLSGMLGGKQPEMEKSIDEDFVNEPDEKIASVDTLLKAGNDLHKEKESHSDRPYLGDNPRAVRDNAMLESLEAKLWREFQKDKQK